MFVNLIFIMNAPEHYTIAQVADILGVSKETLRRWERSLSFIHNIIVI